MALPLLPLITGGGLLAKFFSVAFIVGMIAKVLATLGLSYYAFVGIDASIDALQVQIDGTLTGMPFEVKNLLDMSGITTILTWLLNAHAFSVLVRLAKVSLMRTKAPVLSIAQ